MPHLHTSPPPSVRARGRPFARAARAGFTVIEVLVAAIVLTVGLLALAATFGHLARTLTTGAAIVRATHEARSTLERQRARRCTAAPGIGPAAERAEATVPLTHGARVGGAVAVTLATAFPCPR
jgi:Tfp pilus assembly protein PilV